MKAELLGRQKEKSSRLTKRQKTAVEEFLQKRFFAVERRDSGGVTVGRVKRE